MVYHLYEHMFHSNAFEQFNKWTIQSDSVSVFMKLHAKR